MLALGFAGAWRGGGRRGAARKSVSIFRALQERTSGRLLRLRGFCAIPQQMQLYFSHSRNQHFRRKVSPTQVSKPGLGSN